MSKLLHFLSLLSIHPHLIRSEKTLVSPSQPYDEPTLTLLPNATARCLDGSPPGFYFSPALKNSGNEKNWVLFLQGGGECTSAKKCKSHLNTHLGSSKYFQKKLSKKQQEWLVKGDKTKNPDLYSWNRVFLPYCSQDLWTGMGGELEVEVDSSELDGGVDSGVDSVGDVFPESNNKIDSSSKISEKITLRFYGHLILSQIVEYFEKNHGLASAENIILSGESAGGFGVVSNVDFLYDRYQKSAQNSATRVVGAPVAGYYSFAYPYIGPGSTGSSSLTDFREPAWPGHGKLWKSYVNEDCRKHKESLKEDFSSCILANVTHNFLKSECFWSEAQTDKIQILAHDWIAGKSVANREKPVLEYIGLWKKNMTRMLDHLDPKHGYFNPACWIHTTFYHDRGPFIKVASTSEQKKKRFSYLDAFGDWFFGRGVVEGGRLADGEDVPMFGGDCPRPHPKGRDFYEAEKEEEVQLEDVMVEDDVKESEVGVRKEMYVVDGNEERIFV